MLLEQVYVIDGESRVKQIVEKAAKEVGAPVKLVGFARMALGEGIEKEEKDFASEVAAQLRALKLGFRGCFLRPRIGVEVRRGDASPGR